VELKVFYLRLRERVPKPFLIYRVELKVKLDFDLYPREPKEFLIYRVELKDAF